MKTVYLEQAINKGMCFEDAFCSLVEENLNIVLPKGDFYLNKTVLFDTLSIGHDDGCGENTQKSAHLVIKGLKNLTIKGAIDDKGKPTTRLFGYNDMVPQSLKPSILWAEDCPNLKLENIEFALSKHSSFVGTVIKKTEDYIVVKPQKDDYPEKITPYCMNAFRNGVLVGQSLTIGFDVKDCFQKLDDGNYKLLSKSIAQKVTINDELSWHLSGLTDFLVFIGNCDDIEMNNIRISDTCGFGLLTEACNNIIASKIVIKSHDGHQPVSRDGWKIYRCSGKVQVTDSWIEGTRMDGQNVHGNYLLAKGINGNKLYLELKYAPTPLKVGSELRFYKDDEIGKGTILSCEVINSDYRDIEQQGDNTAARAVVGKKNRFNTYCVELDEIPTGVDEDTFVVANNFTVQEYICSNTVFRNIAGCGNLVRSRTAVLENNRYENIMNAGILAGSEWDTHLESTNPEKITIRNCNFKNTGFVPRYGNKGMGCISVVAQGFNDRAVIDSLVIENCAFQSSNRAVEIRNTRKVTLSNNTYCDIKEKLCWRTNMRKELITKKLELIYHDNNIAKETANMIEESLKDFEPIAPKKGLDQRDSMIITYADSILQDGEMPLVSLSKFLKQYVKDAVETIHILPFFPYTSDDGFSVVDYGKVNPDFGTWNDVGNIAKDYGLMIDSVANHVSKSSEWFQKYLNCEKPYDEFFITSDPNADYSSVIRPRALPLLTAFDTKEGKKYLWTTFSEDQIDLNFKSPKLLVEIIKSVLNYAKHGARFIRLDAIGFIWKELGSSCMHLPQCHEIIKLIRIILEDYAPGVMLITETNVPQKDNVSYFGNNDEAMMVYQFPLPPLVMYTMLSGSSNYLREWVKNLYQPKGNATYFNFLSSHDGIGLRPVDGILKEKEKAFLVNKCLENGGKVSYKDNGDGTQSPYEMNIVYLDALKNKDDSPRSLSNKFIAAMTILLSLQGVPGIYIHSLLGSHNDYKGVSETGMPRRINREKLDYNELESELNSNTERAWIFNSLIKLLNIRKETDAFSPYATQKVLDMGPSVFALERKGETSTVQVLINVSNQIVNISTLNGTNKDLISNTNFTKQALMPYQCLWLVKEEF